MATASPAAPEHRALYGSTSAERSAAVSQQDWYAPMGNRHGRKARRGVDPSAGIRALRLEQLFREELNSILDGELGDQRFEGVRVTLVELSRDGSRARIWFSMKQIEDTAGVDATRTAFEHASAFFRTRLCDALPLKRSPELSFRHDPAALRDFTFESEHP